jgi:oligoendopeptidase F
VPQDPEEPVSDLTEFAAANTASTASTGDKGPPPPDWNLGLFYARPDDPAIHGDLDTALAQAHRFAERYRGQVPKLSASELHQALEAMEALIDRAYRPPTYAMLLYSTATGDAQAQALRAQVRERETEVMNQVRFFDVELKDTPAEVLDAWLAAPELSRYWHYLRRARRQAPHLLSEAEERLGATKDLTGRQAWAQLYTELTSSFRFTLDAGDGDPGRERTLAEVRAQRSSPRREVRERALTAVLERFRDHALVLNYTVNTLYQDHRLELGLRRYGTPIAPTVLDDELSEPVVEALMSAVEEAYPLAQEYYRLKAKALGIGDFASHDVLAPYEGAPQRIPFADARREVVTAFGRLDGRFATEAERFFDEHRIDARPRPGKRDGAFCSGTLPSLKPFVLTNYTGRVEDVATIAHELGHGVHFVLAGQKQSPLNYWPTTPLAETASVFGELLLARHLLDRYQGSGDREIRRALLALRIEDAVATIMRQVMYTRFEQKAHARRAEGVVPAEEYGQLWATELGRLYGDAVTTSPLDSWGWITIPHLVQYRFYCYSYAFGMLLVFALYKKWEREGSGFVPGYLELLSAGGSLEPERLLAQVGVDIADPGFWRSGLSVVREDLEAFRAAL